MRVIEKDKLFKYIPKPKNDIEADYYCEIADTITDLPEYIIDDEAADVQPVDRWISVDDRLPEEDGDCLVWYRCDTAFGKSESWGIAHCSRGDWYTKHLNGDNIVVLYWQSMPEPPETAKG